jgi:hypothetical protein
MLRNIGDARERFTRSGHLLTALEAAFGLGRDADLSGHPFLTPAGGSADAS